MSEDKPRRFASRPGDAEQWVKAADKAAPPPPPANPYTARLTIDVTPELRHRLKLEALHQGVTVANMLRWLLEREYPETSKGHR